ncbi:cytosolic carboxypeptidase 6 [Schistocerca piceifrons]|uniref:cytosolic carboxypeptidase 6 n=1 Tax=Schistocerca piceifrons TaxID=274613 RepID=UPI001F5FB421|nr:cytosolic carboxypeptidase 6 [Schistocerca piceifrons]
MASLEQNLHGLNAVCNLGRVDLISEFEYDLFIRPDTCNPRFRLWFNFIVDNVRTDQRVIFNIVNFSKTKNLFRDGMTPLVKSTSRPKWQRMPNKHVYYYRSPEHQQQHVLSFAFAFDREEDVYQFALTYPYSYSRCQAHLDLLERKALPHFKRELLATSVILALGAQSKILCFNVFDGGCHV